MPIEVIGAGFGRTGTMSLKVALEELGFTKCYHMVNVLERLEDARIWNEAAMGRPVDWDRLFEGYRATVDWPGCSFYRELMRRYPEAKVILTVRDPGRWYDSALQTIYFVRHAFPEWIARIDSRRRVFRDMLDRIVWDGTFQGRFEDRDFALATFERHNEQVRREVPTDRLLVFDVREGWEPLCRFLGVPVLEEKPFPHLNDAAEFRARIEKGTRAVRRIGYVAIALGALAVGSIAVAVAMALRG
jgi:hypothetical protein